MKTIKDMSKRDFELMWKASILTAETTPSYTNQTYEKFLRTMELLKWQVSK